MGTSARLTIQDEDGQKCASYDGRVALRLGETHKHLRGRAKKLPSRRATRPRFQKNRRFPQLTTTVLETALKWGNELSKSSKAQIVGQLLEFLTPF